MNKKIIITIGCVILGVAALMFFGRTNTTDEVNLARTNAAPGAPIGASIGSAPEASSGQSLPDAADNKLTAGIDSSKPVTQAQRAALAGQEQQLNELIVEYDVSRSSRNERTAKRAELSNQLQSYSEEALPVLMEDIAAANQAEADQPN